METSPGNPDTRRIAKGLATRLQTLDAEFRTHHFSIVDLIDDDTTLDTEQGALDDHDDNISQGVRIHKLISTATTSPKTDPKSVSSKRLAILQEKLNSVAESIRAAIDDVDSICKLEQHQEQMTQFKKELKEIQTSLLEIDLEVSDPLMEAQTAVESSIFDCSLTIKKRLHPKPDVSPSTTADVPGAKLLKLEVPTFDGDILNCKGFWEQLCVPVHTLTNAKKLVYLQNSLKDGAAKCTIEGLTESGEHYEEAVKCLTSRYDQPRLIHQTHVRKGS